ncbi:hypothetical protein MNBD_GAMMA24-2037 [hydrothermal vent metagenome]|uniref:Uncharacterized protein n=1 Tax=hydrothermal vent metagenome TaxID=652676 RepID=A0A3B1BNA7_9ZZZZ
MASILLRITLSLMLAFMALSTSAETRIEMQGTAIIGNRELPKILYIVPWKKSGLPKMKRPPINQMINEVLAPLDREEFRRQIYYHRVFFEN